MSPALARLPEPLEPMIASARLVVLVFAAFLFALAAVIYARPALAARFLGGFAGSARAHYAEQVVRLVVGGSLFALAPEVGPTGPFRLVGGLMVATSIGLLLMPWRWHRRFADRVIPPLLRHMGLYALALIGFGLFLLYGLTTALR